MTEAVDAHAEDNSSEILLQSYIRRVIDHDQPALELLYEALLGQVYGLALRITQQASMAEEVVQDTFWQVWRQAPRFDPARGSVRAWVLTMARSRALDALRRLDEHTTELEDETANAIAAAAHEMPPDLLNAVQQGQLLHTALAELDSLPRQLLSLAFFRGLSHDEIAQFTGLPLGSVKSQIRRALLTLRQLLATTGNEGYETHG